MQTLEFKYLRRAPTKVELIEKNSRRFLRCWDELYATGFVLPPNFVADLLFASERDFTLFSQPGESYSRLESKDEWDSWIREQWIPWSSTRSHVESSQPQCPECIKALAVRFGAVVTEASGPRHELESWQTAMDSNFKRLWKLPNWTDRGMRLRKEIRARSQLHEMIGISTVLHARCGTGQYDRLFGGRFASLDDLPRDAQLVGSQGEGDVDEVVRRPYGTFREQSNGPLPRNLGNLSPVELAYMAHEKARMLFRMHVANSTLDQRSFESSITSDQRALVHVEVRLLDDLTFHQWKKVAGHEPAITHYRACLVAILGDLLRAYDPRRMDLRLHAGYVDLKGIGSFKLLDANSLQNYFQRGAEEARKQLALHLGDPGMIPDLFRESPYLTISEQTPFPDEPQGCDRVVRIALTNQMSLDFGKTDDFQVVMENRDDGEDPRWAIYHPAGQSLPEPRAQMLSKLTGMVFNHSHSHSSRSAIALEFRP